MSYWKASAKNIRSLDSFGLATTQKALSAGGVGAEFYELELGVVLDIVLDENHPVFSQGTTLYTTIDADNWPADLEGNKASSSDKNLSWIGRALVRPLMSEKTVTKDKLGWAYPLESNLSEYPLLNETVILVRYFDRLFYTRKLNFKNWPHDNLDFGLEPATSGKNNTELYTNPPVPYQGPLSVTKYQGGADYSGVAGKYFVANNKVRTVKRFEGDLLIESRFGQCIHFSAYDSNRDNDKGDPKYPDYKDGGNPMILIRNRQRQLVKEGKQLKPHKKLPAIEGTKEEKNVGGYLEENINHDGSSIHITCGQTISQWVTTCYKKMYGEGEEVGSFQGSTTLKFPVTLNGDQIVVNSDRLILSSRYGETFHYAKKRYGVVTDNEYTVDAHQQIVLTTNTKTVINSPAIYLGEYDVTDEPALLGQTTVNWLYELCNWLIAHIHKHVHGHVDAGSPSPMTTQTPVDPQVQQLIAMRDRLKNLMSRRVFLTGGGLAPGQNGGSITDGSAPTKISVGSGGGVPGGWKGSNYRPA